MTAAAALHLVPDREPERACLALQSPVWESATRTLLDDLGIPAEAPVLHLGPDDDVLSTALEPRSQHVVHARFQLAVKGHAAQRLEAYRRLVAPGGVLIVEEPDTRTWLCEPYAPATSHLVGRLGQVMKAYGGDLDAGRRVPALLRRAGLAPQVRTHTLGLEAGHRYLQLPLDLADSLGERLADVLGGDGLAQLRRQCADELATAERRGTTFTLVQAWVRIP
jgi:hypothetical protein